MPGVYLGESKLKQAPTLCADPDVSVCTRGHVCMPISTLQYSTLVLYFSHTASHVVV